MRWCPFWWVVDCSYENVLTPGKKLKEKDAKLRNWYKSKSKINFTSAICEMSIRLVVVGCKYSIFPTTKFNKDKHTINIKKRQFIKFEKIKIGTNAFILSLG